MLDRDVSIERDPDHDGMDTAPIPRKEARLALVPVYHLPMQLGRYLLLERIGVGGMAEVFVAQQDGPAGFQKKVVLKRILPHLAEDERFIAMFQREARLAASLSHTNVVQVFELGTEGKAHFIAMELVDGLTVHRLARRAWRAKKSIPLEVVCGIVADTALGLHHAHELSMVHRDISPENLMVNVEGITKILDFGIARSTTNSATLTKTGELKGKLPYMSPEAIRGDDIDGRSDLYALGVTMYWLLTGKRPITSRSEVMLLHAALTEVPKPPSTINASVPHGIDDLVCALLEKDPAHRPATGRAVYDALAADLPPRSLLSAPFVQEVMGLSDVEPEFEVSTDDGFIPSSPQTSRIISGWQQRVAREVAPGARGDESALPPPARGIPRSAVLAGVVAVAALGAGAALLLVRQPEAGPLPAPLVPVVVAPAPEPPAPVAAPAPPLLPLLDVQGTAEIAEPAKKAPAVVGTRRVELRAPAGVRWSTSKGRALGAGTRSAEVPADAKSVVAVDGKRGVKSTLSISDGKVDYDNAPRGKLDLRAFPYAEVFLGSESLGVTPLQPMSVVAGSYTVRFVFKGKEEKRTIALGAGKTERVIVDFR